MRSRVSSSTASLWTKYCKSCQSRPHGASLVRSTLFCHCYSTCYIGSPLVLTVADELQTLEDPQKMEEPVFSQTLSAAVQIALVNLLESWGIYPAAVIGHSSGEVAAAYASKAIPLRTAIIVAYYRGLCAMSCPLSGGMAVVGLGINAVKKYLKNGLVVACENGPETVNISGNRESLAAVVDQIKADNSDTFSKLLPIRVAYHSR